MTANRILDLEAEGLWDFTRQRDWFDPTGFPDASVSIVGCGGIGSPTALLLSKIGIPNLVLCDPDLVETHNVPNQFYSFKHVGIPKVKCLEAMIGVFGVSEVHREVCRFQDVNSNQFWNSDVFITGLDSMEARRSFWDYLEDVHKDPRPPALLIDARIGGMDVVIYSCEFGSPESEYYNEHALYTDEEAIEAPCTARGRIDLGFAVGSIISSIVIAWYRKKAIPRVITYNHENHTFNNSSGWIPETLEAQALKPSAIELDY